MEVMLSDCMQSANMLSESESDCMLSHRMMSDQINSDISKSNRQYRDCVYYGTDSESNCMMSRNMTYDKANSDRH